MSDPHWTAYFSALLTPIVAVFGIYIATQQWRTARNKLKLDLFDKRLAVYEATRSFLASIITSGKITQENEMLFLAGTRGAKWLFGNEIEQYIDKQLWNQSNKLICLQSTFDSLPSPEERESNIKKQTEIKLWFNNQLVNEVDNKFSQFLSLQH